MRHDAADASHAPASQGPGPAPASGGTPGWRALCRGTPAPHLRGGERIFGVNFVPAGARPSYLPRLMLSYLPRLTGLSAETDAPISVTPQYPTTTRDAPVRAAGQVPTRIVRRVVATPPRQIAQHLRRRAPRARLGRRALSIVTEMTRICQTAEPCAPPRTLPARRECWFKSRHWTIEYYSKCRSRLTWIIRD